uniref:CASP-like protein n=1 Tax=Fagus sylvatica TaxID=28930 RepID=A0A2N9FRC9_FAGSY
MMEKRATSPIPMDIMGPTDEEGSSVSSMRTAETLLRLVPMTLCIAALVVMVKNSQTNDFGSLSYSDLRAFSTGTAKTPPYPYRVPRGYGYCRGTAACVPPAYPFSAKKKNFRYGFGTGRGRVGSGMGRDKTKAKRRHFKGNLKPIYLLHPILSHSFSSATPLSLFFAFDSSTAGALGSLFLTSSLYRRRATALDHLGSEGYGVGSSWIGRGSESYSVEEKCPDEPLFALYVANLWRTELTGVESLIEYLVYANGICAGCSLLSAIIVAMPLPSTMSCAWTFFFLDQVLTYIILAVGAMSLEAVYLAYKGDTTITWSAACGSFGAFCHKATTSIALTFVVVACYALLSLISSYRLFSRYDAPVADSSKEIDIAAFQG